MCPGLRRLLGVLLRSASARTVALLSLAEMPVLVPSRRSTETVKAVYMDSMFSFVGTIRGRSRRSQALHSGHQKSLQEGLAALCCLLCRPWTAHVADGEHKPKEPMQERGREAGAYMAGHSSQCR